MDTLQPVARLCGAADTPDDMIAAALAAAAYGEARLHQLLETLDAPVYVTDAEGWVTFCNRACIDFVGRVPIAGEDRWCVTWRLYSERGEYIPPERCPMAIAIKEARPARGVIVVAERPDGSRVMFLPHPTPIIDAEGLLRGAVNLLIDVTDQRQAAALQAQAMRCRRLAQSLTDTRTVETLAAMADEYEAKARSLREV